MYPIALEFFNQILGDYVLTDNLILCTLFAGIGIGISLGMIIRTGASTGGVDVPPLILNKYFRFPVSVGSVYYRLLCHPGTGALSTG